MRWLVDECVDAALVELLRQAGHDVVAVSYIAPRATDLQVMSRAEAEGRLLLTEDKDFGDLAFRRARRVPGIVSVQSNVTGRQRDCSPPLTDCRRSVRPLHRHRGGPLSVAPSAGDLNGEDRPTLVTCWALW
jgi:predicted nuclease of predicted toxin-antitoxin system